MELTSWQQAYLADIDEVPGLDAEETRLLVGRFAFGAGDDTEVTAVLTGLDTSDREWLAVTMYSLGVATGHASEARIRHGASMIDLRESVEIEPSRESTLAAAARTTAVSSALETAFALVPTAERAAIGRAGAELRASELGSSELPVADGAQDPDLAAAQTLPRLIPHRDPRPSMLAQRLGTWWHAAF